MADYIYLLENRLSRFQRQALGQVRDAARAEGMTVFLVGGAVRDLTSGAPIRDLNFVVQGDARQLSGSLSERGKLLGTHDLMQALYFSFPGGVRLEVSSSLAVTFPQPGKPVVHPAPVLEDLRGRDFTVNAMAISLNDGSYGLLMDPTNGVADVENRELRLLSNYGFLEDPARMIRAVRLGARLGWTMDERTQTRYENAKTEQGAQALGDWARRYETEAIFREEDPIRTLRKLEAEGWVANLSPLLAGAKLDEAELDRLRDLSGQLNTLGIFPDTSSAVFPLLTAKLGAGSVNELKQGFALSGFAGQIEGLEEAGRALAAEFTSKSNAAPSAAWKLLMNAMPEAVLWMAFSSKSAPVQAKLKLFFNEWPRAQQHLPYQQMQEMRITADLPGYDALLDDLFFAVMDGKLDTPEAIKAFLEPFSPPAAPPPPTLRRRAVKRETKTSKSRSKKAAAELEATPDVTAADLTPGKENAAEAEQTSPEQADKPAALPAKAATKEAAAKPLQTTSSTELSGKSGKMPPTPAAAPKASSEASAKAAKARPNSAAPSAPAPVKKATKPVTNPVAAPLSSSGKVVASGSAAKVKSPTQAKAAAKPAAKAPKKSSPSKVIPKAAVTKKSVAAVSKKAAKKGALSGKAVKAAVKSKVSSTASKATAKPPVKLKAAVTAKGKPQQKSQKKAVKRTGR